MRRSRMGVVGIILVLVAVAFVLVWHDAPPLAHPLTLQGEGPASTATFSLGSGLTLVSATVSGARPSSVQLESSESTTESALQIQAGDKAGSMLDVLAGGRYHLLVDASGKWVARVSQPRPAQGQSIPRSFEGSGSQVVGPVEVPGIVSVDLQSAVRFDGASADIPALPSSDGAYFSIAGLSKITDSNCAGDGQNLTTDAGPNYIEVTALSPVADSTVSWTLTVSAETSSGALGFPGGVRPGLFSSC